MPPSDQTRLLIVEDVPQVAQYIRDLLNAQSRVKLLEVLTDGSRVVASIRELRPDIILVDALLQGRVKGPKLVEMIHEADLGVPVIVLTVPQNPVEVDLSIGHPRRALDAVLRLRPDDPDRERTQGIRRVRTAASTRVMNVFAPKGGVGKTTIAFNLAVALGQLEQKTVLIDGSLQFGDLRSLLKVPVDAPSILDLPTDRIAESDLSDVLWRDPSGIDILLAPPRIEMAEMLTPRDVDKVLSLLRRVYASIVIDMSSYLNDINLAFLDASDVDHRDRHLRLDDDPQHGRHRRHVPVDRLPGVQGPLSRQPGRLAGRHRADRPRAGARPRPRAPRRVGRPARRPVEQRGRAVRPGQPGGGDQPGHHARGGRGAPLGPGPDRGRAVLRRRCRIRAPSGSSTPASAA